MSVQKLSDAKFRVLKYPEEVYSHPEEWYSSKSLNPIQFERNIGCNSSEILYQRTFLDRF